jgi:hypothetical protein
LDISLKFVTPFSTVPFSGGRGLVGSPWENRIWELAIIYFWLGRGKFSFMVVRFIYGLLLMADDMAYLASSHWSAISRTTRKQKIGLLDLFLFFATFLKESYFLQNLTLIVLFFANDCN